MERYSLTEKDKSLLIAAARASIAERLSVGMVDPPELSGRIFDRVYGIFVTLKKNGDLRGCIGHIEGYEPLRSSVRLLALQAAFHDPRFEPLEAGEWPDIKIEISVLYPLEPLEDPFDIEIGRHGLVIEQGAMRGILLPQVPVEWGWNVPTFLDQICRKAGLPSRAYEHGARLFRFEAEVFGEA